MQQFPEGERMTDILEWLVTAEDTRQQSNVNHLMNGIIAIVFLPN